MLKLRLARHGRKRHAYYHIVAADSRAPRDGKYIEQIGVYNPNTDPAYIEIDFDKSLDWLFKGAQPTETVRAILSYKGVLYKKHLLEGVKKGAFDEKVADERFKKWLQEKEAKIQAKRDKLLNDIEASQKQRLEAEVKVKEDKAELLAKKYAAKEASENTETEEAADEANEVAGTVEPDAKEEVKSEEKEAPKVAAEEKPKETVVDKKKAETAEPKAEEKKEDEPKA